jgi:hypothetical protein
MTIFLIIAIVLLFAVVSSISINRFDDSTDDWDYLDYHRFNKTHGSDENQNYPPYWGPPYPHHPYDMMKKMYDVENQRINNLAKIIFILLLMGIAAAIVTYFLGKWGF